jgi:outer membrane PBP1 activator LpoA protein
MTPEDQARLKQSVNDIAAILYKNTPPEQVKTLEGIEKAIRQHAQETVLPQLALFLQQKHLEQMKGTLGD